MHYHYCYYRLKTKKKKNSYGNVYQLVLLRLFFLRIIRERESCTRRLMPLKKKKGIRKVIRSKSHRTNYTYRIRAVHKIFLFRVPVNKNTYFFFFFNAPISGNLLQNDTYKKEKKVILTFHVPAVIAIIKNITL